MPDVLPYDLVVDQRDFIYMVVALSDAPTRLICQLKYVPFDILPQKVLGHSWIIGGEVYTRITTEELEAKFHSLPNCLYSSRLKLTLFELPLHRIKERFSPAEKAKELLNPGEAGSDLILRAASRFLSFLTNEVGIDVNELGITGSILLNAHIQDLSDIDVVTYKAQNSYTISEYLKRAAYTLELPDVIRLKNDTSFWENYSDLRSILQMPIEDYAQKAARTVNKGWVLDIPFSIFAYDERMSPKFSLKFISTENIVRLQGRVVEDSGNYLMPSRCQIKVSAILRNEATLYGPTLIDRIVSVESWCVWYVGHMQQNEEVDVEGALIWVNESFRIIVTTSCGYISALRN